MDGVETRKRNGGCSLFSLWATVIIKIDVSKPIDEPIKTVAQEEETKRKKKAIGKDDSTMAYLVHQGDGETDAAFHFTVSTPLQRARRSKTAAYKNRPQAKQKSESEEKKLANGRGGKAGGCKSSLWEAKSRKRG